MEEVGQLLQLSNTTVVDEAKEDLMVSTSSNDLQYCVKKCYNLLRKQTDRYESNCHEKCYEEQPEHLSKWLV